MRPKAQYNEDNKQIGVGLLEYLEDIIGTNEYIPELEE
jgi:hypothetical protein